jgi:MSHA biogenesis protein MshN
MLAPRAGLWWMGMGISLQADNRSAEALDAFRRAKSAGGLSPDLLAFVDQRMKQLQ